jgi:hypothetical protein
VTTVQSHGAVVTIINRNNTWTSKPRLPGTSSLTIEWSAVHTTNASPNTAKVTIKNLSRASQDAISDVVKRKITWTGQQLLELALAGASTAPAELVSSNAGIAAVRLEVSEGASSWLWFVGNSSKIVADGESLTLECADFVDQVGAAHVLPPRSFAKGTPVLDVIEAHINAMGLSVERQILEREFYAQYAKLGKVTVASDKLISAITTSGPAVEWLRKLFKAIRMTWMVQNGVLHLLGDDSVLSGFPPIEFRPSDGSLIGRPTRLEDGAIKFKCALRPGLIPARACRLHAAGLGSANYRIRSISSSGSTESGSLAEITMEALSTIPGVL